MAGTSKVLDVPYLVQPDPTWCQSTVLKMMAMFIENSAIFASTGGAETPINSIWEEINQSPGRPEKARNAHKNMVWWLEKRYDPPLKFSYLTSHFIDPAIDNVVRFIDGGFPVIASVSHQAVKGHIILIVGYDGYEAMACSAGLHFVVHDPYGRFDPTLSHRMFGQRRWEGGVSLAGGAEKGPGQFNRVPVASIGRHREGDAAYGNFYFISCRG
jgi:hypothetical protein